MIDELVTYRQLNKIDPTGTTGLRNAFSRDIKRRFGELTRVIRKAVVEEDCFGLRIQTYQMSTPGQKAFAFSRSAEKVDLFMVWLKKQVDKGIVDVRTYQQVGASIEAAWTNLYIYDSYKRGLQRARQELIRAGYNVPSLDATGGIEVAMQNVWHAERVGLLFSRVYSDLKGVTAAMDTQISRVLSQGMIDGDGMLMIARKLVATINGTGMGELGITNTLGRFVPAARRAEMIARTETIRAFHLATIQEYRNWGIYNIIVLAEWRTAGDDRVCEKCASMNGKVFTLDEIEPMIPLHPQCRCIALPWVEELQKYYTKNN
jgi:SPP1 gp7 family putative phage head morphogenesis protein